MAQQARHPSTLEGVQSLEGADLRAHKSPVLGHKTHSPDNLLAFVPAYHSLAGLPAASWCLETIFGLLCSDIGFVHARDAYDRKVASSIQGVHIP